MLSLGGIITKIGRLLHQWAAVLLILLFLLQIGIVVLRYVFAIGWPWATDLLVYLFSLSVLAPALAVLLGNTSVRVDVFYTGFRSRRKAIIDRLSILLLLVPAMSYTAWQAGGYAVSSWAVLESSPTMGGLPGYFLLKTAVALFFLLMALGGVYLLTKKSPYDYGSEPDSINSNSNNSNEAILPVEEKS